MADWDIQLFGEPNIQCHGKAWTKPESAIAQEIFLFLLSHRRTVHSRESLASLLWSECSTEQSKKNLRQTLWRLRSCDALPVEMKQTLLLAIDKDHIQLNPDIDFRIDTEEFERIYRDFKAQPVIDESVAQRLREAARLYRGGFLEGYWHDWCLFERERFQNMYLAMMDKLIEWCISQSDYDEGMDYGERILQLDPASERAHQQMMRLHHLSGNRTAALRQFERCVRQLKEELDVNPSASTIAILAQIKADGVDAALHHDLPLSLPQLSGRLRQFQMRLAELQKQIQKDIEMVEHFLPNQTD
jgi:DNA-binding SARP family transcriptional activator